MPQTPLTGATPYLTAARTWLYKDSRPVLELLTDDDTIPPEGDAENDATEAGAVLLAALVGASGEVEEYAMVGGRYLPADLAALTGNAKGRLEGLVADLAFWRLSKRRWPRLKPEDVSGAAEALAALKRLADGETIFGTVEAVEASIPNVTTLDPGDDRRTVRAAGRFFGNREPRGLGGAG